MTRAQQLLNARRLVNQIYIELVPIGNGPTMHNLENAVQAIEAQHKDLCCQTCGNYKAGEGASPAEECKCVKA